jgi:acylphosphatase
MSERQVRAIVTGRVQGVWYRKSTLEQAAPRGLRGTVRNLPDGSVEIVARGPAQRVAELLDWAEEGPPDARVDGVRVEDLELDDGLPEFQIVRG